MNRIWLLVLCWSHCAQSQILEPAQHIALMSVYDGLGLLRVDNESFCIHLWEFFFFSPSGCNETVCPRFIASLNCFGAGLSCSGGNVTQLCVLEATVCVFSTQHRRAGSWAATN
jgi:hypothetical protein